MSYAIVGFGKIGQALAHAFARKNIDVALARPRHPRRWRRRLGRLDPRSSSSRCGMHSRPTQSSWPSRSMNMGGGCEVVQTGAKFVKGFNHLPAATLAADPIVEGGHRVVFLSSDDDDAIAPVADLARQLGFAPVELGKLNEGGALVHGRGGAWGQLIFEDLFKKEQ